MSVFFPLEPWNAREGDEWNALTDLDCDVEFEGQTRHFWLRQVGNLLCFVDKENDNQSPIFALTHLLAPTHERAQPFRQAPDVVRAIFVREFAARRWGTYHGDKDNWNMPCLCAIFCPEGRVYTRPWYDDRPWLVCDYNPQKWNTPRAILDWQMPQPDKENPHSEASKAHMRENFLDYLRHFELPAAALRPAIRKREPLPRQRAIYQQPFRWQCGSEEQTRRLTRAVWQFATHLWDEHPDASSVRVETRSETPLHNHALDCLLFPDESHPRRKSLHSTFLIIWHGLITRFNCSRGATWQREWEEDADPPHQRWHLVGYGSQWDVPRPTMHDRLESALILREWMQDKVDSQDIARLLEMSDDPAAWQGNPFYGEFYRNYL